MNQKGHAGKMPDFEDPALGMAAEIAPAPDGDAKKEFETGLPGRFVAQATLLAKSTVTYLLAVVALYGVAWWIFGNDLSYLMESARPWPQILMITFPLLIVGIPLGLEVSENSRRKRLEALAVSSECYKPGFFRLEPYDESDAATFKRSDGAHEKVLYWLLDTQLPSFRYLTAASGAGKTSLLQAHVLPQLRNQGWLTVNVRALEDGVAKMREELLREGAIWRNPPEISEPRELLERAAAIMQRSGKQLLLLIDQFEEVYILESESSLDRIEPERAKRDAANREVLLKLLHGLAEKPVVGLIVLLSLRKDYEEIVIEHYGLPSVRQNENRRSIELFDVPAAMAFLRTSGATTSDEVLRAILTGAGKLEDREGLFRPVLLNLIGLQLVRSQGRLPCPPEELVGYYLLSSLSRQNVRDVAWKLLSPLVSDQGTALTRPLGELAETVGRRTLEVKGLLRSLREDGLVRPLGQTEDSWQIAHDFLARQIGLLLGHLRCSAWHTATKWAAPVLLLGLFGTMLALPWWTKVQAHAVLSEMECPANGEDDEIVIFCNFEKLQRMVESGRILNVRILKIEGVGNQSLAPISGLHSLLWLDLSGTDVDSLEPLRRLTYLMLIDISDTKVVSLEPLRDLTHLHLLDLSSTKILNLEPIRRLTTLISLDLSDTKVESLEPIRELTALISLDLDGTKVEDLEPIRRLTALKSLNLNYTAVESLEPIRELAGLISLGLARTKIENFEPIRALIALESLKLTGTKVENLEFIRDLTALKSLDLTGTNIESLEPLRNLTSLSALDLTDTQVKSLEPIRSLTSLNSLNLTGTRVENLEPIRNLTSLNSLSLTGTPVKSIEPISGLSTLTYLDLSNTQVESLAPIDDLDFLDWLILDGVRISPDDIKQFRANGGQTINE